MMAAGAAQTQSILSAGRGATRPRSGSRSFPSVRASAGYAAGCAASSATSAGRRQFPSCSRACAGSSIAGTTRRGWPCWTAAARSAQAQGADQNPRRAADHGAGAGSVGISHTRWATHGRLRTKMPTRTPITAAARPGPQRRDRKLRDAQGPAASEGHIFRSQTDTEVLAHLVGREIRRRGRRGHRRARLVDARARGAQTRQGTYGIVIVHQDVPEVIVGARMGSPLVLGSGQGGKLFRQRRSAIVRHTREAVYLKDCDVVALTRDKFEMTSLAGGASGFEVSKVEFAEEAVERASFRTTCSRKSSSSRNRSPTPCAAGSIARRPARSSAAWT